MLSHLWRASPFQLRSSFHRLYSTNGSSARSRFATRRILFASGATLAASALYVTNSTVIFSEPDPAAAEDKSRELRREPPPLSELVRTYIVYSMCSFPTLVDWSPALLHFFTSIPGLKQITETIVYDTFFLQVSGLLCLTPRRGLIASVT
jgi:proline dehydrogenase